MALGRLDLAATTETLLYTCPAGKAAAVNVTFTARTQAANIRLALTSGGAPAATDWIAYDYPLKAAGDDREFTQIWVTAGEKLYAYASATGVSVLAYGPEESV